VRIEGRIATVAAGSHSSSSARDLQARRTGFAAVATCVGRREQEVQPGSLRAVSTSFHGKDKR
jgi:hypothetical protein